MANRIQFRRDSAQRWASINPVLMEGEIGFETDTNHFKLGNGTDAWNSLEYGLGIENITSELGNSENLAASQKLVTEELEKKLSPNNIVQMTGDSTEKVMSQNAVTDIYNPIDIELFRESDTDITAIRKDYNGNRCFVSSTAEAGEVFDDSVQSTDYSTYCLPFRFEPIPNTHIQITIVTFSKWKYWFFVDEQGIIISTSELPTEDSKLITVQLKVPENAKYLYVQTYKSWRYATLEEALNVKYLSYRNEVNEELKIHATNLEDLGDRFQILKNGQNVIPDGANWEADKCITKEGVIEEMTGWNSRVCENTIPVKPNGKYHYTTNSPYPEYISALVVAIYNKDDGFVSGAFGHDSDFDISMPKEAAYVRLAARASDVNASEISFSYVGEDTINDTAATACEAYYDNSANRVSATNAQAAIDEIVYERDGYAPTDKLNMANASMECNLVTTYLTQDAYACDPLVPFIRDCAANYKDICGISVEGLAGHGRFIPDGKALMIDIGDNVWYTFGFWIRLSDFGETDKLYFVEANGAGCTLAYSDVFKKGSVGYTTSIDYYKVVVKVANFNGYSYIQLNKLTDFQPTFRTTSIQLRSADGTPKQFYVHNFTSFVGTWDINPFIHYETLPERFGSNCIGKILCLTGDSNGGGGVGTWKRLSWAARFLGMPMINASNGGWSMQARMLSDEASNYGWLYYHKWRNKILAQKADIYYFNQCTNDACMGRDETFVEGLWQTLDMDNFGGSYGATKATAYGTYGTGEYVEIKKILETYTDDFAKLLEAGDLQALYNGEKLITILRRDMTTLGCTGAFIAQIHSEQPNAKCIVDSTISSIGCINSLIGSFNASGVVSTSRYESNSDGDVVYPPALLTEVDDEGYVKTYISNGTLTGTQAITTITDDSTLTDGNNYSLYYYYMYKQYGINPDTTEATAEQIKDVCQLCHKYYEDNVGSTYVRTTPLNLMKCAAFTMRGQSICNQIYREGVSRLQSLLRVPFIDAGYATNISLWNVGHIAADAGHYTNKGMKRLGNYIATQINHLFLPEEDAFREEYGEDYEDYFGE